MSSQFLQELVILQSQQLTQIQPIPMNSKGPCIFVQSPQHLTPELLIFLLTLTHFSTTKKTSKNGWNAETTDKTNHCDISCGIQICCKCKMIDLD